ncbi:small subunit rRNA processing protein, putative [Plasmodium vivax]|uniref:(malaria parasite P. vivax) hypothetical protein n=1 Tax=Plasmodium vivax TaxID=5855 RepID=A0A1G4H7K5_PLAVI|nr:unnamed protein product [Plasmodium vivax]SCO70883.1 small subunit rRNA processing protein, putative [Plasmodium vivax]
MDQDREKAEEGRPEESHSEESHSEESHPEDNHPGEDPPTEDNQPGEDPPTDERFQFDDNIWKRVRREESKKGIVYLADVPIGLNAARLREIFSQYGSVGKIHLNRAKDGADMERGEEKKKKKKKKKIVKYQDGYIEFINKRDAKKAVRTLNNQLIGGKKRKNMVRDSFWHLKLIKDNFLWSDIMSSALYRRMSRKDRLTLALKDMYKGYEAYVERKGGSAHRKVQKGGGTQKGGSIQKGDPPQNRKKGPRVKRPVCPLRFVTVKKGESGAVVKEATEGVAEKAAEEVPLAASREGPPPLRRNGSAVSANLLKLLM